MYYCCSIDLDWIIRGPGAKFMAEGTRTADGKRFTETEWITRAAVLKAKGMESLPTCNNHDALGNCKGHADHPKGNLAQLES